MQKSAPGLRHIAIEVTMMVTVPFDDDRRDLHIDAIRRIWRKHMCEIYAGQDPQRYRPINRSIRMGGHSTSIQLEAAFWVLIDEIAEKQGFSTSRFISTLYDEALELNGSISNFSSLLRTSCLIYLMSGNNGQLPQARFQIIAAE